MPWTGQDVARASSSSGGDGPEQGPKHGRFQQAVNDEPAFAGGGHGPRGVNASLPFTGQAREGSSSFPENLAGAGRFAADDDRGPAVAPRGSRAGLMIAIASLVVIAAGFTVVYLLLIRTPTSAVLPELEVDAAVAVVPATTDAAATVTAPDAAVAATSPTEAAAAELAGDVEGRMRAALAELGESAAKDDPQVLAMRARLSMAIAQSLEDRAALLSSSERAQASKLRQASKAAVLAAIPWAQRAIKGALSDPSANLAMADLLRLQGKSSRDLRRYLDAARASDPKAVDLALVEGLVLVRDGKLGDARRLWSKADEGEARLEQTGDVRLRLRIALAAFADGKAVEARAAIDPVIAAQPEHEVAKALIERLDHAVTDTDPLPPEEGSDDPDSGASGSSSGASVSSSDTYEKLVQKGNRMAEKSCAKAIALYQAALDKTPNGVDALVGMGYCHIDTKQFSSANSRFRTVLALQSKNERALWGIAQAYQEQGLKPQAIEAYQRYLEVFPSSAPAKRQLERLGAGGSPETTPSTPTTSPAGGGEDPGEPAPSPTPSAPTPTPAPAPATPPASSPVTDPTP